MRDDLESGQHGIDRGERRLKGILALLPSMIRSSAGNEVLTADIIEENDVVVLMLLDLKQPFSLRLYRSFCEKLNRRVNSIRVFVALQGATESFAQLVSQQQFVAVYNVPMVDGFGMWKTALGFSACPALAVVDSRDGRKISHSQEELAVLWNDGKDVQQSWVEERTSALTRIQKVQAALLFPSCVVQ